MAIEEDRFAGRRTQAPPKRNAGGRRGGLSGKVEAVEMHDLMPGGGKVMDELFFGIVLGVELGDGA